MNQFEEFLVSINPKLIHVLTLHPLYTIVNYNTGVVSRILHNNRHLFTDLQIGLDLDITSIYILVNSKGGPKIEFRDKYFNLTVSPIIRPTITKKDNPHYNRVVPYHYMEKSYGILESHELVLYNYLNLGSYYKDILLS